MALQAEQDAWKTDGAVEWRGPSDDQDLEHEVCLVVAVGSPIRGTCRHGYIVILVCILLKVFSGPGGGYRRSSIE